jgi:hypothetical protein
LESTGLAEVSRTPNTKVPSIVRSAFVVADITVPGPVEILD